MFILCVSLLLITHIKYKNHVSAPKIKPQNYSKCMAPTAFFSEIWKQKNCLNCWKTYHWECDPTIWCTHNGAPACFTHEMQQFFDSCYPHHGIGPSRPVLWPLLLLDIVSANFCLWSHLKGIGCSKKVTEQEKLWCCIELAVTITWHAWNFSAYQELLTLEGSVLHWD